MQERRLLLLAHVLQVLYTTYVRLFSVLNADVGHDIASDYCRNGVGMLLTQLFCVNAIEKYISLDVTLFQRGPTYVMTTKEGAPRIIGGGCIFLLLLLSAGL
jgi:hypothetical protein